MTKTNSLALTPEIAASWTEEQIDLIRDMSAKNCTPDEFKVLLYVAHQYKLDPLTKQIYAQKYQSSNPKPAAIIITYAGMLEIANRGGGLDGLSSEIVYDSKGNVAGARSTLWKKGATHPFLTEVDLEEYFQTDRDGKAIGLWGSKPKTMIRKVANAQNIRQAFSLGQMYIEEEMPQPQPHVEREVEVIEARPLPQVQEAEPRQVQQIPQVSDELRHKRVADAAAIDLSYGVRTVDDFGFFLKVSAATALKTIEKMTGATHWQAAANLVGLPNFRLVVRDKYPDALIQPQQFAATLHFIFNWMTEQAELKARKEAAHAQAS